MDRDRIVFARHESIAPLRLAQFVRALSGERFAEAAVGLRRYRAPLHFPPDLCVHRKTCDPFRANRGGTAAAANSVTTLVLDSRQRHFSTAVINSALISWKKSPYLHAVFSSARSEMEANKRKSVFWLSREESLCHGESCLDVNL
jgi:hypothetical protein